MGQEADLLPVADKDDLADPWVLAVLVAHKVPEALAPAVLVHNNRKLRSFGNDGK